MWLSILLYYKKINSVLFLVRYAMVEMLNGEYGNFSRDSIFGFCQTLIL